MPVKYAIGDMLKGPEKILVHGCNAQGVMGSGVAKAIRSKYPKAYEDYRKAYETTGLNLGDLIISDVSDRVIINAITQQYYGRDGKRYVNYGAVQKVAEKLEKLCLTSYNGYESTIFNGESTIAMPMIGAGLGGGDWNVIDGILYDSFNYITAKIYDL